MGAPLDSNEPKQPLPSVEAIAAEIEAIKALSESLLPLDQDARRRVVRHVSAYFQLWNGGLFGERY